MARMTLDDVLADDDDLLDVKLSTSTASTEEQRILQDFEAINTFIDRFRRKPGEADKISVSERGMQMKLAGLMNDAGLRDLLLPHDRHELLPPDSVEPQSLDDILDDDDLLATPSDDIFNLVHARPAAAKTDMISERQICKDFDTFKPLFDQCVREINEDKRKVIKFKREQEISAGEFFILNGVMVYVAQVGETHIRNGKKNARLRLIFDNGTEGKNLLRSLASELYIRNLPATLKRASKAIMVKAFFLHGQLPKSPACRMTNLCLPQLRNRARAVMADAAKRSNRLPRPTSEIQTI